jgi:hypothetical protein
LELIGTILIISLWYLIYKQIRTPIELISNNNNSTATNKTMYPTIFKNIMSIHIWLKEITDYMSTKNINTDKEKTQLIIEQLDKDSQTIIKEIMKTTPFTSFKEFEDWLKTYLGISKLKKDDYQLEFMSRQQQPDESLTSFYKELQDLVILAHPNAPVELQTNYINERFVKG